MHRKRRGLSLLEVILALAILGGALATIGELMRMGTRSAEASRDGTEAQLLCESKLAELAAGALPLETVVDEPADPNGEWVHSVESQPVDEAGLIAVRVTVRRADDTNTRFTPVTLTRWIVDPGVEFAAREEETLRKEEHAAKMEADAAVAATANNSTGTNPSGNNSSGSGNSGSTPSGGGNGASGGANQGGGQGRPPLPPGVQLPPGVELPPDFKLPPGFQLPPDGKLPPGMQLPPGLKLPPGLQLPPNLPQNPGGNGPGGRGNFGGGRGGQQGGGGRGGQGGPGGNRGR